MIIPLTSPVLHRYRASSAVVLELGDLGEGQESDSQSLTRYSIKLSLLGVQGSTLIPNLWASSTIAFVVKGIKPGMFTSVTFEA